jgi:hypothetical protein
MKNSPISCCSQCELNRRILDEVSDTLFRVQLLISNTPFQNLSEIEKDALMKFKTLMDGAREVVRSMKRG